VSCRLLLILTAIACLAASAGCRRAGAPVERIAILRFENTGADPADDWMGRVLSEAVAGSLARTGALQGDAIRGFDAALGVRTAAAPGVSSERSQAILAGAGLIGYGTYRVRDGQVSARLTVQSVKGNRTLREIQASGPPTDLLGVAERLARAWNPQAEPYFTKNLDAARAWSGALEATSPEAAFAGIERAIAADPAFAPPHLLLAQARAARQDRAAAETVLRRALDRSGAMTPAWKARLEFELAAVLGDAAGQTRALAALAQASPEDPVVWRAAGDSAFARKDMAAAVAAYRKTLSLDPNNILVLNQMGYALAALGDWNGALEALNRYRSLRPDEANPLDSLGEIHFQTGRFPEAAKLFEEAHRKNSAFAGGGTLFKAAVARLLSGDTPGADTLARQFIELKQAAGDPIVEYRKAEWSWLSGRRQEAYQRLAEWAAAAAGGPAREMASRAYAQLAVWNLALGKADAAAQMAARCEESAGPASAGVAAMIRFLAQPQASSSEWAVRAERAFPDPAQASLRSFARAYALLFAKDFQAAALLLREMQQSSAVPDPGLPVLVGWSYLETGKAKEAEPLLAQIPLPSYEAPAVFSVMHFPRVFYLRAVIAARRGQADAARQSYRTFLQLSGNAALEWGEEARAASKVR
jgi:tetratricopeptide (TPR) repeat protein